MSGTKDAQAGKVDELVRGAAQHNPGEPFYPRMRAEIGGVVFEDLTREQCEALRLLAATARGGGGGGGGPTVASAAGEPEPEGCELTEIAYMLARQHLASMSEGHRATEIAAAYVVNGRRYIARELEVDGRRTYSLEGLPSKGRSLTPGELLESLHRVVGEDARQRKLT